MNARRDGLRIVGVGAACVAACSAGPLLAFLGGLGLFGLASTALFGILGAVIAGLIGVAWVVVRHRRLRARARGAAQPVVIAPPVPRPPR